jgi:hypothetical protein
MVVVVSALLAATFFVVQSDVLSAAVSLALPLAVSHQAVAAARLDLGGSVRRGTTAGSVHAVARSVVTLVQYYGFDWRTAVFLARSQPVPPINAWTVGAVVLSQLILIAVRVAAAVLVSIVVFALVKRSPWRKLQREPARR